MNRLKTLKLSPFGTPDFTFTVATVYTPPFSERPGPSDGFVNLMGKLTAFVTNTMMALVKDGLGAWLQAA